MASFNPSRSGYLGEVKLSKYLSTLCWHFLVQNRAVVLVAEPQLALVIHLAVNKLAS